MAKTLNQLLAEVKRLDLKVDLILLDKGFCWREILGQLNKSGYKYLVAAKKDKVVKEAMLDYVMTKQGRVRPFSRGVGVGRVDFNLTIHRFRKTKSKLKNILELYGAFITNMELKEALEVWSNITVVNVFCFNGATLQ